MSDDEVLRNLLRWQNEVEGRMAEEIRRRQKVSPNPDVRAAVDFQIEQEREKLRTSQQKFEKREQYKAAGIFLEYIIDEWLPEIGNEFIKKNR